MPITQITEFQINSSFDYAVDSFAVQSPSSDPFRLSGELDTVYLSAGFRDSATNIDYTIGLVHDTVINTYELSRTPNSITTSIKGRDSLGRALDRYIERIYTPDIKKFHLVGGLFINAQVDPTGPAHLIPVSQITRASAIAADLCRTAGFEAVWQCRDYTLKVDFDATGRLIDVLQRLSSIWSIIDIFRVDVFVQNSKVFFRPRKKTYTPDYTFSVLGAKIKNLNITKSISTLYGRVTIEGEAKPAGLNRNINSVGGDNFDDDSLFKERTIETFDAGVRIMIQKQTEQRRAPDGAMLVQTDTLIQEGDVVKKETRTHIWEDPSYGPTGQLNQPLELETRTDMKEKFLDTSGQPTFATKSTQRVTYSYDEKRLQTSTVTETKKLNLDSGSLERTDFVIKALADMGHNQVHEVTTTYGFNKTTQRVELLTVDSQVNAGQRPGGAIPPQSIFIANANADGTNRESIVLERVLSTDVRAVPFKISNPNWILADLNFLMDEITSINGGWIYEVSWTGISMPWIKIGNVVQLTGLVDHLGNTITLGPMLITTADFSFRQGKEMLTQCKAIFWSAT